MTTELPFDPKTASMILSSDRPYNPALELYKTLGSSVLLKGGVTLFTVEVYAMVSNPLVTIRDGIVKLFESDSIGIRFSHDETWLYIPTPEQVKVINTYRSQDAIDIAPLDLIVHLLYPQYILQPSQVTGIQNVSKSELLEDVGGCFKARQQPQNLRDAIPKIPSFAYRVSQDESVESVYRKIAAHMREQGFIKE